METDRLVIATAGPEEDRIDRAIRPRQLSDYVGQRQVHEQMEIFVGAAHTAFGVTPALFIFRNTRRFFNKNA